jgi:beta-lactamase regulating signal transducer with metallopeptidase domain
MNSSTDWLIGVATHIAVELVVWSWQALVLIFTVWIGLKIWRPKSPSLRHQVWLFALIAVAMLPLTTKLAERFPEAQLDSPTLRYAVEAPLAVINLNNSSATTPAVGASEPAAGSGTPSAKSAARTRFVPLALFAFWLAGSLFTLARLAKNHFKIRRALKHGRLVTPAELDCAESLMMGRVRLRLSRGVQSPILFGVFRPSVLLPDDLAEWTTPAERYAVIQHELAHAERRDTIVNLFQNILQAVLFFHPLVRYAARQLSLEREMACDDRVVGLGTASDAYAEGILKVAERCISSAGAPAGVHQLALFSARQILERRIEMILNRNRVRLVARQWKYLILPACLIAAAVWLLAPGSIAKPGAKQDGTLHQMDTAGLKDMLVKYMGDSKAYDDLIDIALNSPDIELRQKAVTRLTTIEGDGSEGALIALYEQTRELAVKEIIIHTFGRRSEIEPLAMIAQRDPSEQFRQLALEVIKWLKETTDSNDIKSWDSSAYNATQSLKRQMAQHRKVEGPPPLPPPPPPHPDSLTVSVDAPSAGSSEEDQRNQPVFALLREAVYASLRHDPSVFERILADDYLGTDPDGRVFNREQEIAEVRRLDFNPRKFVFNDYTLSGDEGMAVANFIGTVYFDLGSAEASAQFRYTVTLARRQDLWKVVAIHVSRKQGP